MRRIVSVILACSIAFLGFGFNIFADSLTVEQAVDQALKANIGLKGEKTRLKIKKRDNDLAFNKLYPSITVGAGITRLNDTTTQNLPVASLAGGGPLVFSSISNWNIQALLSAQLTLSMQTFVSIDQTATDYENAQISYDQAAQRLEHDVRKAFYQLLLMRESIKLTRMQVDNAEARYRHEQTNYRAGKSPELLMLQAQVEWENQKPGLQDMLINYNQVVLNFETALDLPPDTDLELSGSADISAMALNNELPPAQMLIDRYLDRRIDLRAANGQIRFSKSNRLLADSEMVPALIFQFSLDPTLNNPWDPSTSWWGASSRWVQPSGAFSALLSWKIDTFIPGSAGFQKRANAADQVSIAEDKLREVIKLAQTEIVTLHQRIEKSLDTFVSLTQNANVARRAYELAEGSYKVGALSLIEVEEAARKYWAAQLLLLNERQTFISSSLDLELALNTKMEEIYGTK